MAHKEIMLQFFAERAYAPQPLEDFEKEVRRAVSAGAKYVYIGEIPKQHADWTDHPGDPYPNWGMLLTNLFKIALPEALRPYLSQRRADENLRLLSERAEVLHRYGLRAALFLTEPFYLPERAYLDHPRWRGPRCDHPRRSRDMYFSPCVDEPEVLSLYAAALDTLFAKLDIGYMQIITNDSGAGLCWTAGLYNGANGPAACRHRPLQQRLLGFLDVFQEAAKRAGREVLVDLTSNIGGYKESESAMNAVYALLKEGQIVNSRARDGSAPVSHVAYGYAEQVRPLRRIPLTLDFLRRYDAACQGAGERMEVIVHETEFDEYLRILRRYDQRCAYDPSERMALLRGVAAEIVGEEQAGALLDAWCAIDEGVRSLVTLRLDCFFMMAIVSQRLLTRPFVPRPDLLTDEETAAWRPYLFQATTEAQAWDMMNIQGMHFISGFAATRMASLTLREARGHFERAADIFRALSGPDAETNRGLSMLAERVTVLALLTVTLENACRYQEILDRTAPGETPERATRWPLDADERILKLCEIARDEIDNTYALHALLSGRESEFVCVAGTEEREDIFLMHPRFAAQLPQKAETMLRHMRDVDDLYESNNK